MKRPGSSEEKVAAILESSSAHPYSEEDGRSLSLEPPATEGEGGAATSYNLNDYFERKQYADSMRQEGMCEQEIEGILEEFVPSELK